MLSFLKNHPFAVEAFFERSVVLTFAFPKEILEPFIPECLKLDTFNDTHAFVAVALVQTKGLRPKGFPAFMGNDFYLIGYRIFVRYINNQGKRLRGLYILKSMTDKRKMELLGNVFTHYNYTTTDISEVIQDNRHIIHSIGSGLEIEWQPFEGEEVRLPEGSPFSEWADARRFSGPLPFTFTYNGASGKVLIIEGVRQLWKPYPIKINTFKVPLLDEMGLANAQLASAFAVDNTPYYWKKGRVELWKP